MGINVTAELKLSPRIKRLCKNAGVKQSMNKAIKSMANDLLRVGMERAPYKTGTLEHSGTVKFNGNGQYYEGKVSFVAVNAKGENYAKRMDSEQYNLGKKSIEKSSKSAHSAFSEKNFKVGTGYLSDTAKACQEGYKKHMRLTVIGAVKK